MKRMNPSFRVCQESAAGIPMFGIRCGDGTHARGISTDYKEVYRLAQTCNRCRLSPVHLMDVVEDFRRS